MRDILCPFVTELAPERSHPAEATRHAFSAVRPVAGGTAALAVARRPGPPARPGAQGPATAPPEPQLPAGRPDHDPRPAHWTVSPPAHRRARQLQTFASRRFGRVGQR